MSNTSKLLRSSFAFRPLSPPFSSRHRRKSQPLCLHFAQFTRPFVSSPTTPIQTLTASRILPYPSHQLYNLIADISSYPSFLPYCLSSQVVSSSSPDAVHGKSWPHTASLHVGWGPYNENFTSTVYCLPYTVLEACAGDAVPTIPASDLSHYQDLDHKSEHSERSEQSLFSSLLTRWTFKEFPFKPPPPDGPPQEGNAEKVASKPRTEVNLMIEVQFANAVYGMLSQAAAPKVAGMMVEAFEKRARDILGHGHVVDGEGENRGRLLANEGLVGDMGKKESP